MNDLQKFLDQLPTEQPATKSEIFKPDFDAEYELARRIGEARFASECRHETVKDGRCLNCLRQVYAGQLEY